MRKKVEYEVTIKKHGIFEGENEEAVKKLEEEVTAKGQCLKGYKANVLDAESLAEVHEKVLADLGPCDILINGAGGNNPAATADDEFFSMELPNMA